MSSTLNNSTAWRKKDEHGADRNVQKEAAVLTRIRYLSVAFIILALVSN